MINYIKNKGIENEYKFINYFSNKYIYELNPLAYDFIIQIFGDVGIDKKINVINRLDKGKTDFVLIIDDVIKYISVKSGSRNSVHLESIGSFISFLRKEGLSEEILNEFLKYHYADGSIDGSGKERIPINEYKKLYQSNIDEINKCLSKTKIVDSIIRRAIIEGRYCDNVDAIIYGNVNDFLWLTKEEIFNIILSQKDNYSTGIHFGPLFCQPWTRNLQNKYSDEYKRDYIQIKWYSLFDDIIKTMAFFRNK